MEKLHVDYASSELGTHFALSFHSFVERLPFNQEHGYLLV
jgi:hypothetical protein